MELKLTPGRINVLVQSLNAVGWHVLPAKHPERVAAEAMLSELKSMQSPQTPPQNVGKQVRIKAVGTEHGAVLLKVAAESDAVMVLVNAARNPALRINVTLTKMPDGTLQGSNGQTWEIVERL